MKLLIPLVYLALCYVCALLGENRKFGFWGYLICSIIFTPLVGLVLLLASDERPRERCRSCKPATPRHS